MSTGQQAAAVLFGREGNGNCGITLAMCYNLCGTLDAAYTTLWHTASFSFIFYYHQLEGLDNF